MADVKETDNNDNIADSASQEEEMKMADLLGPEVKVEEGKVIKARVVAETDDGFLVDLGLKSEGLVPKNEFSAGVPADFAVGQDVHVVVLKLRTPGGHPLVSYRQVRDREVWERLNETYKAGAPVEGVIRKKIKGGFTVDLNGVDAFLPASQLELRFAKDTDKYIGQKYAFVITDLNRAQKNVVVSRRRILEAEQKEKRGQVMANLADGQVIDGTVSSITDFGAFVDIGGVDGLLHIGDITWYHLKKVEEVLKTGQQVRVQVLKIDREKGKISLGMKQISPRPWDSAVEKYPVGLVVKGKITSITEFGIFVEVEPGLEGLLHVSELTWTENEKELLKKYKVGAEIEAKIIIVDPAKEKLSLSVKRMEPNPWEEAFRHYTPGTKVKGTITHLTPFGAFVKLPEGIEGLIHVGDISWTKKVRHPQDALKTGEEVEVIVLEVNPQAEKIALSLKHLNEDPFRKYKPGTAVTGVVKRFAEFGAFVELEPGVEALVRLPEISFKKIASPEEALQLEQTIEAKVIKSDPRERKIDISIRKLEHDQEKALVKKYANKTERPTLGQLLEEDEE